MDGGRKAGEEGKVGDEEVTGSSHTSFTESLFAGMSPAVQEQVRTGARMPPGCPS